MENLSGEISGKRDDYTISRIYEDEAVRRKKKMEKKNKEAEKTAQLDKANRDIQRLYQITMKKFEDVESKFKDQEAKIREEAEKQEWKSQSYEKQLLTQQGQIMELDDKLQTIQERLELGDWALQVENAFCFMITGFFTPHKSIDDLEKAEKLALGKIKPTNDREKKFIKLLRRSGLYPKEFEKIYKDIKLFKQQRLNFAHPIIHSKIKLNYAQILVKLKNFVPDTLESVFNFINSSVGEENFFNGYRWVYPNVQLSPFDCF